MVTFTQTRGTDHLLLPQRELLYAARLENLGPKATLVPIGDERYGALSGTTVKTLGDEQVTGTLASGNWNAMATPLRGSALVPVWTPDGANDWIEFADADFWTDTADGTAPNEPSYTFIVWVNVIAGGAQRIWMKTAALGTTGTDWGFFLDSSERPNFLAHDDSANAFLGRRTGTALSGWHHIVVTKSTGTTNAAIDIYVDAVVADSANNSGGTYVAQENGSTVVRIGAETDGGNPLFSPLAGGPAGPLFIPGQVLSLNQIKEDDRTTRAAMANYLGT